MTPPQTLAYCVRGGLSLSPKQRRTFAVALTVGKARRRDRDVIKWVTLHRDLGQARSLAGREGTLSVPCRTSAAKTERRHTMLVSRRGSPYRAGESSCVLWGREYLLVYDGDLVAARPNVFALLHDPLCLCAWGGVCRLCLCLYQIFGKFILRFAPAVGMFDCMYCRSAVLFRHVYAAINLHYRVGCLRGEVYMGLGLI